MPRLRLLRILPVLVVQVSDRRERVILSGWLVWWDHYRAELVAAAGAITPLGIARLEHTLERAYRAGFLAGSETD